MVSLQLVFFCGAAEQMAEWNAARSPDGF